jgi:hypothetical protein
LSLRINVGERGGLMAREKKGHAVITLTDEAIARWEDPPWA